MNKRTVFGIILPAAIVATCAGCFTAKETPFPETALSAPNPAVTNLAVEVRGFETSLTEYVSSYGWQTYYVPGYAGHHHWHPGYYEAVPTSVTVAQQRATDLFLRRAKNRLEEAGYSINAKLPDYIVEVSFEGPFLDENENSNRFLWQLCTIFFSDSAKRTWNARMKIYDNKTGQLAFHREYTQPLEVTGWAIIPIFGIASYQGTESGRMQVWCLSALTDRATADASAFLSQKKK